MRRRPGCPLEVDVERDGGPRKDADGLGQEGAARIGTEVQGEVPWFTRPAFQQGPLFGDISCGVEAKQQDFFSNISLL